MGALRVILGDQLSRDIAALDGLDAARDAVLMMEVAEETAYVPHHKQKIALILSAMRHFADDLRAEGIRVDYVALDDPANTGSFTAEVRRALQRHRIDRIVVTEPGEWRVLAALRDWAALFDCPVEIRDDTRFFASRARFVRWAAGRKSFRMEYFYREMRRESGLLMQGDAPVGGQWNFDAQNRRRLPRGHIVPSRRRFSPDAITAEVLALVERRFAGHFGSLADFNWPVTRDQAQQALEDFITDALPLFGDYQDAMRGGEPFMHHSLLAPSLNIGLLTPREVCARAEAAFRAGHAPLNAVEGFIRQILGWREYVRGLYWLRMPDYAAFNMLEAQRPLPAFYWSGETPMACLRHAIADTHRHAYSHHIQRLMLTGNFALLAGIRPQAVCDWYLAVYADAFEWVELPNTLGMALFADGGLLASKPYAASGAYIDRMSDFCGSCAYDVKQKSGPRACPFNRLYWAFLIRNRRHLAGNPRLAMPYRQIAAMDATRQSTLLREAEDFLDGLEA
ncbi:MAG: cryptochrome/photolyase family protein [Ferrovibrio sp.]|uniref:cryptochrome/photolyase family protein n=1 Tax=Ferrovibrio sp. TaxID=1917215 RepID=UPI003919F5B2